MGVPGFSGPEVFNHSDFQGIGGSRSTMGSDSAVRFKKFRISGVRVRGFRAYGGALF